MGLDRWDVPWYKDIIMTNGRTKGRRGEIELCNHLNDAGPFTWDRVPGSGNGKMKGDLHSHDGDLTIECKRVKQFPWAHVIHGHCRLLDDWIAEIQRDVPSGRWLICFREDRKPWSVVGNFTHPPVFVTFACYMGHEITSLDRLIDVWNGRGFAGRMN